MRGPPLWLVHPNGGHALFVKRLGPYLDPSQRLYGLQAQGLDGRLPPSDDLRAQREALSAAFDEDGSVKLRSSSCVGRSVTTCIRGPCPRASRVFDIPLLIGRPSENAV